ncbi:GTP-binding protein [Pontimicrobium sp. SW4]|uniref:GTP-binding protein n=1 Tax=Pontimicrobium sp. SW4 TaxID=3153519 RepID=A0AAU7BR13_9FLAO
MSLNNDIVLRPRFKIELKKNNQEVLKVFEEAKKTQKDFIVSRVDDHVFIKIPKADQHFWSPQLHLEIIEIDNNSSRLFGLFGPNPTVWTMFMFFHFIVAGLFIGFGIWAYTNWTLKTDFAIQLFVAILMIVLWVALYFGGRLGKATGRDQMVLLHNFMNSLLYSK